MPKIFQGKIDGSLEHCTTAWFDDIIVVTRGDRTQQEKNVRCVEKLEKTWYRASGRKSEFFQNKIKWLAHGIDKNGTKPNQEKSKPFWIWNTRIVKNTTKSFLGAIQFMPKFLPRLSGRTDKILKVLKKNTECKWETGQENDFKMIKKVVTEEPGVAFYAKNKDYIVTTDASKTGLGVTSRQTQTDGELKTIAFGSRFLNNSDSKYSIGELEILAAVCRPEKLRFFLYGQKGTSIYRSSSTRTHS